MNHLERVAEVETFIFDVDGVLTNSRLIVLENGKLLRQMNTRDGFAIRLAIDRGYRVVIITGGASEGVVLRLKGLGVTDIYSGIRDKVEAYHELIELYDLDPAKIMYMGDDFPDYEVMRLVGFRTCPEDAAPEIRNISDYVSTKNGGDGCVRDVIEKTLKLRGDWVDIS